MIGLVTALRWLARLVGLAGLILGILLWRGTAGALQPHIITGMLMTLILLLTAGMGFFVRLKPALPTITFVWAFLLPYIGFTQVKMFPGASHVVIQVIHLLLGVCAIGLVEALAGKVIRDAKV